MTSLDELVAALPIRGLTARVGSYGNCGGVLLAVADLEAAAGFDVSADDVALPQWVAEFPEEAAACVAGVAAGAAAQLRERFGAEPGVRLVLRRLRFNPPDAVELLSPKLGRRLVAEAVRRATTVPVPWPQRSRVELGRSDADEPVALDIKGHDAGGVGPHGLLVGAPGSGRAAALRGVLTALTRSHAPEELRLLLLDADGSAGFDRLAPSPHRLAGFAVPLDRKSLVEYACRGILAELDRREALLADAGDLDSYAEYQRALASGRDLDPLPGLLIVVDGFGRLLAVDPELVHVLVRLGRSGWRLGVNLLLAADRIEPGRLRGLDGFLSYRIALRTDSAEQSRVAIGVSDAVDLPDSPGSALLKAGTESLVRFRFAAGPPGDVDSPRAGSGPGRFA